VLSLKVVRPSQAAQYYAAENGHALCSEQSVTLAWGKGADELGLGERIDVAQLNSLLSGLDPTQSLPLTQRKPISGHRRAALDLTISAPKSFSLAILEGNNTDLKAAHQSAVEGVLDYVQNYLVETRIWGEESRKRVQTGNLIAAIQNHSTSRALDPQVHSHCLVINSTVHDKKRYSLANEPIWRQSKFLQLLYSNQLALGTQQLGYAVERRSDANIELSGYHSEQLREFSQRRQQIIATVGQTADPKQKQWACLSTRPDKLSVQNFNDLREKWRQRAADLNVVHPQPSPFPLVLSDQVALQSALDAAIDHCSERRVDFSREDILTFLLQENLGKFDMGEIITNFESHPQLLTTKDGRYTTIAATVRELQTLELLKAGFGVLQPLSTPTAVDEVLAETTVSEEQSQAIRQFTACQDQFFAWIGVAGAGKSYALQTLKELMMPEIERGNIEVQVLAPTGRAAKDLGEDLGLPGKTLDSFLNSQLPTSDRQIWLVDEAGLISARLGLELMQAAKTANASVLFLGDTRQLSSVEAGSFFRSLLSGGVGRSTLNQSQRQKTQSLKQAVDFAAQGQHLLSLRQLQLSSRVSVQPDASERSQKIADDFLAFSPEDRSKTLVLAGTHKERQAITKAIRTGMQQEGSLGAENHGLKILKPKDLTQVQARYCHNYQLGDILTPTRTYPAQGLEKFRPYQVLAVGKDCLQLVDLEGKQHQVDPMKFRKQVYRTETIEIALGERLKSTKREGKLQKRDILTVNEITSDSVRLIDHRGRELILNLQELHHFDHAIVDTVHAAQGATSDRVLYSITSDATVAPESFYVGISRARKNLQLYVQDVGFLTEQLHLSKAQRNPLELLDSDLAMAVGVHYTPYKVPESHFAEIGFTPFYNPHAEVTPAHPPTIQPHHWQELVVDSAIDPELATLNCESVAGKEVLDRLLSTRLADLGSGQYVTAPMARVIKRYESIVEGGWWAKAGIQALSLPNLLPGNTPNINLWGSFKPDAPREDAEKSARKGSPQFRKYEHPAAEKLSLFLFQVPEKLAAKIYAKHGAEPSPMDLQRGFWYIVRKYNLPITITEGAKKTLASLSQGEITIGLSGVGGGYLSRDLKGEKLLQRRLHPELAVFATPGREFRFAFDQDPKTSTVLNVRRDMVRTGELLEQEGCIAKVLKWQEEKGLDDLIVQQGPLAYALAHSVTVPLSTQSKLHYRTQYNRLVRQVRQQTSDLTSEQVDKEVLRLAIGRGDICDGARTLSQSDTARSILEKYGNQGLHDYLQELGVIPRQEPVRNPVVKQRDVELER
jgi:conjugative relaxase-like TrwC/TraI family protein